MGFKSNSIYSGLVTELFCQTMKKLLTNAGVTLIWGTVEENPLAYKDIEAVITAQHDLIDIQGKFYPRKPLDREI